MEAAEKKEADPNTTLAGYLSKLFSRWETTYIRVRQDGKTQHTPLSEIRNQAILSDFLIDQIRRYKKAWLMEMARTENSTEGTSSEQVVDTTL